MNRDKIRMALTPDEIRDMKKINSGTNKIVLDLIDREKNNHYIQPTPDEIKKNRCERFFGDWQSYKIDSPSPVILWEYDIFSPDWNWQKMNKIVVSRIIRYGGLNDYYFMFQKYGGIKSVKDIIKEILELDEIDIDWCCYLFNLHKKELWSHKAKLLRKELLKSWQT